MKKLNHPSLVDEGEETRILTTTQRRGDIWMAMGTQWVGYYNTIPAFLKNARTESVPS